MSTNIIVLLLFYFKWSNDQSKWQNKCQSDVLNGGFSAYIRPRRKPTIQRFFSWTGLKKPKIPVISRKETIGYSFQQRGSNKGPLALKLIQHPTGFIPLVLCLHIRQNTLSASDLAVYGWKWVTFACRLIRPESIVCIHL